MRQTRMLTTALALLSTTRLLAADAPAGPLLKTGDRVAIIGDSITEQKQYSVMIESYLRACAPQFQAAVIQLGWSGERAGGFAKRMDNDLMGWKPTVATLCYGMNDGGYQPYNESIGAEYRKQMSAIAERFAGAGVRVVVGSPGVVDSFTWRKEQPDADLAYNVNLATLGGIGREIARAHGFVFADVHGVMSNAMIRAKAELGEAYAVAGGDGVHPGPNGHLCMAYAFLKGLGLDGRIAEIRLAWPEGAKASEGHTVKSARDGRVEIESTRYPFCFSGDARTPTRRPASCRSCPFRRT
ncbi:MAG: SGNH/GDSL hydrolase family protein [Kiritimatiellia bacterium]